MGEGDRRVGHPVAVVVGQDQKPIGHLAGRLPFRVGRPRRGPEPTAGVHAKLHGVDELGEHLLGGEQVGAHARLQGHALDRRLAAEVLERAELAHAVLVLGLVEVRRDLDRGRHVGVVRRDRLATGGGPDDPIAVGGHEIELGQFVLQDLEIALAVREGEGGPGAPDVVAVGGPVPVEPVPVLVEHGGAEGLQEVGVVGRRSAQQTASHHLGDLSVPRIAEVHAVERQRRVGSGVEPLRRPEQVHVSHPGLTRHARHRVDVGGEAHVGGASVG